MSEMFVAEQPIASRVFTMADQALFATLSGDRNPMHMDALSARRPQVGAPVVHGLYAVLWSPETLGTAAIPISELASAKVRFERFIYLDREVRLRIIMRDSAALKFEVVDDCLPLLPVNINFYFGGRGETEASSPDVNVRSRKKNSTYVSTMNRSLK
jgi:MaoC like domain